MPGGLKESIHWKSDSSTPEEFLQDFPTPESWYERALGDSWLTQNNPLVLLTGVTNYFNGHVYRSAEDWLQDFPNLRSLIEVGYLHRNDTFMDKFFEGVKGSVTGIWDEVKGVIPFFV